MENHYQKIIHHVSTLIINKKYDRALRIIQHIKQQGLQNAQIIVMQSYCFKMIKGARFAAQFLDKYQHKGPLISMAISQYHRELKQIQLSIKFLENIQNQKAQKQNKNSLVNQIKKNLKTMLQLQSGMQDKVPPVYKQQHGQINISAINEHNLIVYKLKKGQICQKKAKEQLQQIFNGQLSRRQRQYMQKAIKQLQYKIKSSQ